MKRPLAITRFYECGLRGNNHGRRCTFTRNERKGKWRGRMGGLLSGWANEWQTRGGNVAGKALINTLVLRKTANGAVNDARAARQEKLDSRDDLRLMDIFAGLSSDRRYHTRKNCTVLTAMTPALFCVILLSIVGAQATMYLPPIKEDHLLSDMLLRELINQMGNELVDVADSYLEYQDNPRLGDEYDKPKEIPIELPADYDGMDTLNPNPSTRDQEYLQHSTLWSHQRINSNDNANDRHRIQSGGMKGMKDEKTENALPAYCTPPNPCPVGYTAENHCLVNFENTAAFSRDYQSAQDCMCDKEHMLDCPNSGKSERLSGIHIGNSDFDQIVEQFQDDNPFFRGEKLPIAAKKGINVVY